MAVKEKTSTLEQLTDNLMDTKGAHILYMFNDQEKYVDNLLAYIIEGLEDMDQIIIVEDLNIYNTILKKLVTKGYTEEQLQLITYISNNDFYLAEKKFNADLSYSKLDQLLKETGRQAQRTRTWGQVLSSATNISEVIRYECKCEKIFYGKNITSVCSYNALTTPAFVQNELLKVHEYIMLDNKIEKSPFYNKEHLKFKDSEQEKLQNLVKENKCLKEKNEKLLIGTTQQKEREKYLELEKIGSKSNVGVGASAPTPYPT